MVQHFLQSANLSTIREQVKKNNSFQAIKTGQE